MLVTLTANRSIDRTLEVPELHRGEVLRANGWRVDPGGKGVNVARATIAHARPEGSSPTSPPGRRPRSPDAARVEFVAVIDEAG